MRVRHGVDLDLEARADALIKESLEGVTKYSEKADILTPWKQKSRTDREVLTYSGLADPNQRQGTYSRAVNHESHHLNSREGLAGLLHHRPRPLHAWMVEQGYLQSPDTPPMAER